MPSRRPIYLSVLALLAGSAFYFLKERPPDERLLTATQALQASTDRLSANLLREAEAACAAFQVDGQSSLPLAGQQNPTGLRVYREGHVVAWSDRAPISDEALDTCRTAHLVLPNGVYLHAYAVNGGVEAHALARLWFDPPIKNQYLQPRFEPAIHAPSGLTAGMVAGPRTSLHDAQGQNLFGLQWSAEQATDLPLARIRLVLLLLTCALLLVASWTALRDSLGKWWCIPVFILVSALVRWGLLAQGRLASLVDPLLFDPSLYASSIITPSLGDLLVNATWIMLLTLFMRRALLKPRTRGMAWIALTTLTLAWFGLAWWIDQVMVGLVRDSSIRLDLFHVQGLDAYSWVALLSLAVLLLGWCSLADALARNMERLLPTIRGLGFLVLLTALFVLAHAPGSADQAAWSLWPMAATLLLLWPHRKRMLGVFSLIALFAFLTAHVLDQQSLERARMEREAIAETSTPREDAVIELLFAEAGKELANSNAIATWMRHGGPCTATELDRLVRQPYFTGYWDRFDLRLHLISAAGRSYCSTSPDATASARTIMDRYDQAVPSRADSDLRMAEKPGEEALYLGRIPLPGGLLVVEIRPRLIADGLGFPELLLAGERNTTRPEGEHARARYERGVLAESSGKLPFPVLWHRPVPDAGTRWQDRGVEYVAQGDPQSALVVVASRMPTWLDHVTAFSFLFLFFSLVTAAAGLFQWFFSRPRPALVSGVRGKVRIGVFSFAVIGLALFTLGMRQLLNDRSGRRANDAMGQRARGVLAELRQTLRGEDRLDASMGPYLDHLLSNLSNVFFTDLSLYATDGQLLATSREQVFNAGLLGRRMDPVAYRQMALASAGSFVQEEHIGNAGFTTAYAPFRNDRGDVLAYLAMPYFARQGELEQERAAGYAALVNLFTLLFLLSALAATLITSWTTRPLDLLRRGLERIALGRRNLPIAYNGQDELGDLVRVYNDKVEELRLSAERLARSERESAWREMARQVAHEIKNPLTPMKLAIQQFERSWTPDAPDAKDRLKRLTNGLVEQIDALGRIAGEFSDFAQMPPAHPQTIDLRDLAAAAVVLFAAEEPAPVRLVQGPPVHVLADKEHMLRVLNNLVKNGLQAVPETRIPQVIVSIRPVNGEALMEVRDNGSGIPPEATPRIFTPNFTTKTSGMGLGLAMVKRMVENAGGRVWFETKEGTGTSFFVALPLAMQGA
jgi:two-component system nitrogen regulation sensor histidine kinase NtrY